MNRADADLPPWSPSARAGVCLMARFTGLARSTIYHGISDIRSNVAAPSGRLDEGQRAFPPCWSPTHLSEEAKKTSNDPTLLKDLKALVEPTTRGDPMRPLLWTCRSLRNLARELAKQGHKVCPTVVGNLLREMDYSLEANKQDAGRQ